MTIMPEMKPRTCQRCNLQKYECMFPKLGMHTGIWCKRCMDAEQLSFATMVPFMRRRLLPTMRMAFQKVAAE